MVVRALWARASSWQRPVFAELPAFVHKKENGRNVAKTELNGDGP
jgi:hypothetical protein